MEQSQRTTFCDYLQTLDRLCCEALQSGDTQSYLDRFVSLAMEIVGGDRAFLALVDQRTGELVVVATAGKGWTPENARLRLSLAQESNRGITGHVALTAQPYRTGDVSRDPHYIAFFQDVCSELAVPIRGASGQSVGVINVESCHPERFGELEERMLVVLAHAAGSALRTQGFRARESALIEIGNNLTATLDIETLMEKVLTLSADMLRFEACTIFLVDEISGRLVLTASSGPLSGRVGEAPYRLGEGITGWVAQHGTPVRLERPHEDPRWKGLCPEFPPDQMGAMMVVPIAGRHQLLGAMRVVRRKSPNAWFSTAFSEGEERILTSIGRQVGAAVENIRVHARLLHAERMAAWGEMSARAAHMIGNRTFALRGDLNELRYWLEERPEQAERDKLRELAASMARGLDRLEEILREFRDFVVATTITRRPCDLNKAVREAVEETFPRRSAITLSLELDEGIPDVCCDAAKLKRAFAEIIENAVSFQPDGGCLVVRTGLMDGEEARCFGLVQGEQYVSVEFSDRGPGIPVEQKERIFEPFHTSRAKGMGLGLSIVKGIVEAHGGVVRETGRFGEGAVFTIVLPVTSEPRKSRTE